MLVRREPSNAVALQKTRSHCAHGISKNEPSINSTEDSLDLRNELRSSLVRAVYSNLSPPCSALSISNPIRCSLLSLSRKSKWRLALCTCFCINSIPIDRVIGNNAEQRITGHPSPLPRSANEIRSIEASSFLAPSINEWASLRRDAIACGFISP